MIFRTIALLTLATVHTAQAGSTHDWGYGSHKAPEHWASLNTNYQSCAGANQSPINIHQTVQAKLPPLKFNYHTSAQDIIHNGHTIQINFKPGNDLNLDNQQFELKQFHLHSPSENQIQGKSYPMEMHLVHASTTGELAVVAVMFDEGKENQKLAKLWKELPKKVGAAIPLKQQDLASAFLPDNLEYYRFNGSLTTPPCTEGVRWIVLKDIQQASKQQIEAFSKLMEHPNNRPVQPQNARVVLE